MTFTLDNGSGGSPHEVLSRCNNMALGRSYDVILCFVDLDVLKKEHPRDWKAKKEKLEKQFQNIVLIWFINNAEEEFKKVLGDQQKSKHKVNNLAKKNIKKFVNSDLWNRIKDPIVKKLNELGKRG
jgi:hypothetical protein